MACPRSATEDNLQELTETMSKKAEELKQVINSDTSSVLSALIKAGEKVKEHCRGKIKESFQKKKV